MTIQLDPSQAIAATWDPKLRDAFAGLSYLTFPLAGIPWPPELPPTTEAVVWLGLEEDGDWEIVAGRLWIKLHQTQEHYESVAAAASHLKADVEGWGEKEGVAAKVRAETRIEEPGVPFYQPDVSVFVGRVPALNPSGYSTATTDVRPVLAVEIEMDWRGNRVRREGKRRRYGKLGMDHVWIDWHARRAEVWRGQAQVAALGPGDPLVLPVGSFGEIAIDATLGEWLAGVTRQAKERERAREEAKRAKGEARRAKSAAKRAKGEAKQAKGEATRARQEADEAAVRAAALGIALAWAEGGDEAARQAFVAADQRWRPAAAAWLRTHRPDVARAVAAPIAPPG